MRIDEILFSNPNSAVERMGSMTIARRPLKPQPSNTSTINLGIVTRRISFSFPEFGIKNGKRKTENGKKGHESLTTKVKSLLEGEWNED